MGEAKDRIDPVTGEYKYYKGKNFRKKQRFKKFKNARFFKLLKIDRDKEIGETPDKYKRKKGVNMPPD